LAPKLLFFKNIAAKTSNFRNFWRQKFKFLEVLAGKIQDFKNFGQKKISEIFKSSLV